MGLYDILSFSFWWYSRASLQYLYCLHLHQRPALLGGRWGVGLAGLSTLAGLGMLWADAKGLLLADDIAHIPLLIWWSEALAFTIAALLLHVTTASLKNALTHVRQSEQALFVKNQELQLRTQELEQQGLALHQSQAFLQAILSSLPAQNCRFGQGWRYSKR